MTTILLIAFLFQFFPELSQNKSEFRWNSISPEKKLTQFYLKSWQVEDGLPQNSILSMIQTRDGYLWIGTYDGLARFDGVNFSVFNAQNHPQMSTDYISSLFESSSGTLWIGTSNGELIQYRNREFIRVFDNSDNKNNILTIAESADGAIWAGTFGGGLLKIQGDSLVRFRKNDSEVPSDIVQTSFIDSEGVLWFGTRGAGVFTVEEGLPKEQAELNALFPNQYITTIDQLGDGTMLFGSGGAGVMIYRDEQVFTLDSNAGLPSSDVDDILVDELNTVWVGTGGGGLSRIVGSEIQSIGTDKGLTNDGVSRLVKDNEGNIWIGTLGGGLNKLTHGDFTTYSSEEGLANNFVWSVSEDLLGNMWVGTNGSGINVIKEGEVVANYGIRHGLENEFVRSVFTNSKGITWVATYGGVFRFVRNQFVKLDGRGSFTDRITLCITEGSDGSMWFGTSGDGVFQLKDGSFRQYNSDDGLRNNYVRVVFEDSQGNLWLGTGGGGISIIGNDGTVRNIGEDEGLSNPTVISFYEDSEERIWAGTHGGGINLVEKLQVIGSLTVAQGLLDNVVFSILPDDSGRLWVSCNRGVYYFQEKEALASARSGGMLSIRSFGKTDGMKSSECNGANQPAAWKDSKGRLWFATVMGASMIDPQQLTINPLAVPVHINEILIDQQIVAVQEDIQLSSGSHRIEIGYTALSLTAPNNVRFRYKMEGIDQEWIDAGTDRVAVYTNVGSGEYRFFLEATNSDGLWNRNAASFSIFVPTPFYKTRTAFLLFGIAAALLIWGMLREQQRRIEQREAERFEKDQLKMQAETERLKRISAEAEAREQERLVQLTEEQERIKRQKLRLQQERSMSRAFAQGIEEERNRIARELHDDVLGSISMLMRRIQTESKREEAKGLDPQVTVLLNQLENLSQDIRAIMDDLKPASVEFFGLCESLESLLRRSIERSGTDLELTFDLQELNSEPNTFVKITIYRIFQEAIQNALKHGGRLQRLKLTVQNGDGFTLFSLEDDGLGFDFSTEIQKIQERTDSGGNGIMNMLHRAKTIGASIEWKKSSLGGTCVQVQLKENS